MRQPSSCSIVAWDGPRRCCSARATSSAARSTRTAFCQVSLARSASDQPRPQQLGDQVRVAGDVVEVVRGERGAVEVAADADVVDAGDLAHVVEVVGDRGRGGHRAGVRRLEVPLDPHARLGGVQVVQAVGAHVLVGAPASTRRPRAARTSARRWPSPRRRWRAAAPARRRGCCAGGRRRPARRSARRSPARSLTRSASRMVSAATCERSTSMPQRFISRTTSSPKAVRPLVARLVGRGVRPVDGVVVGERHVAHAQPVQRAQGGQRVVDGVAALGAHQRRDPALGAGRLHVVGGAARGAGRRGSGRPAAGPRRSVRGSR